MMNGDLVTVCGRVLRMVASDGGVEVTLVLVEPDKSAPVHVVFDGDTAAGVEAKAETPEVRVPRTRRAEQR